MNKNDTCPSCGRLASTVNLDDAVKCDHCYALRRRNLAVLEEINGVQRVVVTQGQRGFQLFINGNLQFSSSDEYIYHESIVHPLICWSCLPQVRRVAILGGGDGLAAREALRYETLESITVVDYDPAVTDLATNDPGFRKLNRDAFHDPRVRLLNRDAIGWMKETQEVFDVVIVDFPDPQREEYAELYTGPVFELISSRLVPDGQFAIQATSRRQCPRSFWCIAKTIESAGFATVRYEVSMRSFGDWSFILGQKGNPHIQSRRLPGGLRFLSDATLPNLPLSAPPMEGVQPNLKNSGILFRYFDQEWRQWVAKLEQEKATK
jgi:spermidine synthase